MQIHPAAPQRSMWRSRVACSEILNENLPIEASGSGKKRTFLTSMRCRFFVSVDSTGEERADAGTGTPPFRARPRNHDCSRQCMPEEDEENIKVPPAGSRHRLALALPVVLLAGVGIWFWANRGSESSAPANDATQVRSTLHLETFVLNLADTDQRSYLRVGIDLGLNQEAKHGEELAPVAQVRDTILSVLAEAKVNDLMTAAGKAKLKENLLHALQERVPQLGVEEVYFTEFLIQR